ncbi:5-formyltetrahydrofolate cyclo-ligase [Acetobacter cerevisiae DSM 14362]|nr:5-formyltetrahydrofolate cyclo-ligase [Acetobacter cerevisiae DSM 14362]
MALVTLSGAHLYKQVLEVERPTAMAASHSSSLVSDPPAIAEAKQAQRTRCLAVLKDRPAGVDTTLAARLAETLLATQCVHIACVWPLPHEIDLRPLCHQLSTAGRHVLLPDTPPRGQPLTFRLWTPSTPMLRGRFGTQVPDGPTLTPDLVLVPLLGFDRTGNRLGYGGGYYDRTLASLPDVRSIGYALAAQEVDQLPTGPYDQPLSCLVTERETLHFD